MSNLELKAPSDDMTPEERESLQNYIDNGKPGVTNVKESDIFQWFKLYMSGKTYNEIAEITNSKKDAILYMSHKLDWCGKRLGHYNELLSEMIHKTTQAKINSINTMSTIVNALSSYYINKMNKAIKNGDDTIIENLDTKLLTQYTKAMDVLDKLITPPKQKSASGDGVPSNPGVYVDARGANISPNESGGIKVESGIDAESLLMALANMKKESEENE